MAIIGVDIGTSGTKTILFDNNGVSLAEATREYPLYQERIGYAEQEPSDFWEATKATIQEVMAKSGVKKSEVVGIGLSGQMHGLVLLDKDCNPLRRAIIWCDQRTAAECEIITDKIGKNRLIGITANPALTGFTASKILWVMRHEPQLYDKTQHILLPKDYVRYKLTGEFATEVSDASGMQLMNIRERCWSPEVLSKLGIDIRLLAKMHESVEITGTLSAKVAAEIGLNPGTPVVGGAGDQAAGAIGNGIVKQGKISATIGSSGVVFAHTDDVTIDMQGRVHTFCHAVPGAYHIMGVTQGAGLSLKWYRDNFGASEKDAAQWLGIDEYVLMDKQAATVPAGCDGLTFLPYMMGERTPHNDPKARGMLFGLTAKHTKPYVLRSIMEGVTYSLADCMSVIREMGIDASQVIASGGGGKSPLWRQMLADVFGCNVVTLNKAQGAATGVAILAAVAAGLFPSIQVACDVFTETAGTTSPDSANASVYAAQYEVYKKLYHATKDLM